MIVNALQESITERLYLLLAAMSLLARKQQAGLLVESVRTLLAHVACERS